MARASSSSSQTPATVTLAPRCVVGEQRLAEPALVVGDEARGGGEDVAGRAVVALQPDHLGAGKILLEAQDVVDLGAAPAVDRLVVVADAADVGRALRQQPQPQVLRDVGVLVLVDQHVAEAALVVGEHVGVLAGRAAGIRAAGRRSRRRSAPSGAAGRRRRAARPCRRRRRRPRPRGTLSGVRPRFFQPSIRAASWRAGQRFLSSPSALDHLLHEADLVVGVEDGEVGLEPDQLGMAAQDLDADRVERAEPRHALDGAADQVADALLHLARRLVGEGDGQDWLGLARCGRCTGCGRCAWSARASCRCRRRPAPAPGRRSPRPPARCSGLRPAM